MNKKQLLRMGVPPDCIKEAIACVQVAAASDTGEKPKKIIPRLVQAPEVYLNDQHFGPLAQAIVASNQENTAESSINYQQWGRDIDEGSKKQMENACRLPVSFAAALMPDAHVGYGLPIGGVLACENAVVPYAVGVDIACRMKMTITDLPVDTLEENNAARCRDFDNALEKGTCFGMGQQWKRPYHHEVLDADWTVSAVTREVRDRAGYQLGTSGSGNHFVEWGVVTLPESEFNLEPGRYVALLSHSGSRGAGSKVCNRYTEIAQRKLPYRYREDRELRHLAWLDLDDEAGQEYWAAMNLMGRYASANHEIIHRNVTRLAGAQSLATIENHHNFAWEEEHGGRKVYVHRKGATPAGKGVLGVIPGNMADSAFIVRGKGEPSSLNSASHGAGRCMSRRAAMDQFNWKAWREHLTRKNVRLLAGGLDEVPGAYKNIHDVMAAQTDLVEVIGEFMPRIVMMCGDGSRAED